LISAKGLTPSVPVYETLLHMRCGPCQELMRPLQSRHSRKNLQIILFRSPLTIGRYISVVQPALRFRNTSDVRCVGQNKLFKVGTQSSQGPLPSRNRCTGKDRFLRGRCTKERFPGCCSPGCRVSSNLVLRSKLIRIRRHEEYRSFLIDHLVNTTLRHWDSAMRQLGAQSIRKLCELDLSRLGPRCASRVVRLPVGGQTAPDLTRHNSAHFSQCLTLATCTVASRL
jgi:hypothetical protein